MSFNRLPLAILGSGIVIAAAVTPVFRNAAASKETPPIAVKKPAPATKPAATPKPKLAPIAEMKPSPRAPKTALASVRQFPYHSEPFNKFLARSYHVTKTGDPKGFYTWMETACKTASITDPDGKAFTDWNTLLKAQKQTLAAITTAEEKAKREEKVGAWLHKTIKTIIPKFSLEKGFELANAPALGMRQCFSQSVLMSSLMHSMGMDGGVVMVWRNIAGDYSNNGHAAVLLKLSNGKGLIVDCSDPIPYVKQQGIFVTDNATGNYRFVIPNYEGESDFIGSFKTKDDKPVANDKVNMLDVAFLTSQFDYYRGERVGNFFFSPPVTPEGLKNAETFLSSAVKACPENPLAVYMLGKVYQRQNRMKEARQTLTDAVELYKEFGYLPSGPEGAYAEVFQRASAK